MMKNLMIAFLLSAMSLAAFAGSPGGGRSTQPGMPHDLEGGSQPVVVSPVTTSGAAAQAGAAALSLQGQAMTSTNVSGASASQALGVDSAQLSSQSVTINEAAGTHYSGEYKLRAAPSMALATPPATADCYATQGISGSGIGFGFGINASLYDRECEVRETVRLSLTSDDQTTRSMANVVLQTRLLGYMEEAAEKEADKVRAVRADMARASGGRDSVTGLPSY